MQYHNACGGHPILVADGCLILPKKCGPNTYRTVLPSLKYRFKCHVIWSLNITIRDVGNESVGMGKEEGKTDRRFPFWQDEKLWGHDPRDRPDAQLNPCPRSSPTPQHPSAIHKNTDHIISEGFKSGGSQPFLDQGPLVKSRKHSPLTHLAT